MDKKKKIVLLSAFYEPFMSGAEQMVREIAKRLSGKYEIIVVTGRYRRDLARAEARGGFRLERVGFGCKRLDKFLYPILAAFKVRALKPDIAHAVMESYAGAALIFVKRLYPDAKRILTLQSGDLDDPKKQARRHIGLFWKTIHRSPHIVTAISRALAKRAENLGVKKENIFITPNGVDLAAVPDPLPEKIRRRVICVGRLSWEKGHSYLLQAWREVTEKFPDARLSLVGEGSERQKIEETIKIKGLGDSVALLGNLDHRKVLEEMARSEVFVCPSLAEGLGIVFIEAQACGTTPIGTRVGGIPDVISDGENGLLVEPKNSGLLAAAIIKLLADRELNDALRQSGLQNAEKFAWSRVLNKIEEVYGL